jgi:hypothetical protein
MFGEAICFLYRYSFQSYLPGDYNPTTILLQLKAVMALETEPLHGQPGHLERLVDSFREKIVKISNCSFFRAKLLSHVSTDNPDMGMFFPGGVGVTDEFDDAEMIVTHIQGDLFGNIIPDLVVP